MKFEWEILFSRSARSNDVSTMRAKVFGGWIVKDSHWVEGCEEQSISISQIFISDPNHEWLIDDPNLED